ncbi:MAG: phosphoribosylformylglycinamidine synthase subunit PurL, partial [Thaumarchaeota archaeon]|nr:phosphoribosylformylglycinamidine synthase subunit PurL [Nitrososphaerota archaeon]
MKYRRLPLPFEIYAVNILEADDKTLIEISEEMGLSLNLREMKSIKEYFKARGRNPTDIELQSLGALWSEHCRHKVFKGVLVDEDGKVLVDNMLRSFIARATEEIKAPWIISFLVDNAGIVEFDKGYGIAAKVETHNHPSAIDPFGGAATGVGGVIRDILGVWGEPIACTDVLCFGPLDYPYEKLPKGIKHPRYLFRGVVAGIGHYGNNMGIPTVSGAIYFDEGYVGNIVVYAGCIGIVPKDRYVFKVKPGDKIIIMGNKTGRDGIHGATFASAELHEESEKVSRPAVQIPEPIEEEKLRRAILQIRDLGLGSGIGDLGGGGLAVAAVEMADRAGCGARIELDKLHLREPDMPPWEIWVSESQERMIIAVPPENVEKVLEIARLEELEASVVGEFTDDKLLRIYFRDHLIAEIDIEFLTHPPKFIGKAVWKPPSHPEPKIQEPKNLNEELLRLLSSPNIASKECVIRTYDHEVQGNTCLKPLQGIYGGPNDAVVLKPLDDSWMGVVISAGLKPRYSLIDPYWMAASSIEEAIRNNVAVGGRRISILDNFTWGSPEKPDRLGSLYRAVKACYDFAKAFETPFISGKDSLYNESPLGPILPTLLITGVGIIPDIRKVISVDLKNSGDPIYLLGRTRNELGGSEYLRLKGYFGNSVPKVYPSESRKVFKLITEVIDRGYLAACHDLSEGGLGVALAE